MQKIEIEEVTLRRLIEAGRDLADEAEGNDLDHDLVESWDRAEREANHALLDAVARQTSWRLAA